MPSVYAHERFGWQVFKRLPEPVRAVVEKHRRQFGIGLQGPDFFFFYKAWKSTPVAELGLRIHRTPAAELFSGFREMLRDREKDSMETACAIGTVCHFMLDSTCHWYVDEQIKETGESHNTIETEFERYLMEKDGMDPLRFPVWKFIPIDEDTAACLSRLYGGISFTADESASAAGIASADAGIASVDASVISANDDGFFADASAGFVDEKIVRACLRDMRLIKRLLSASTPLGQKLLRRAMGLTGHYDEIQGHLMALVPNPRCEQSNRRLLELSDSAVDETAALIAEYYENIRTDTPLNHRFNRDFE